MLLDTYLFNDTLRANILIANPDVDEATLMAAVERASLGEFVAGLPDGLDTKVGERGMSLSGGQRQRVAIARAFLKDAPVLILDEATSHLDAVNEQAVRAALEELMADRTTIVIAHRLSTVRNADLIVALNEGRVIETGTHDELLAKAICMPSSWPTSWRVLPADLRRSRAHDDSIGVMGRIGAKASESEIVGYAGPVTCR